MPLHRGVIVSFDSVNYLATIRLDGSTPTTLVDVRATRLQSAEYAANRRVLVELPTTGETDDAVIVAVYT